MTQFFAECAKFVLGYRVPIVFNEHGMRYAGVAKLNVRAVAALGCTVQINDRRIVEPYTVMRPAYPLAGDKPGGGLNALAFTCKTVLIAVSRYAPRSVAAHFAEASVRVVKQQTIVSVSLSRSNEHKPVCADACSAAAQRARKAGSG